MADTTTNPNTISVNMENLNDTERATLLAIIEKANKPKNEAWKPKNGERYHYIYGNGGLNHRTFYDNNNEDVSHISIGNYFRTKTEAEFALERLKVLAELRELSGDVNPFKHTLKKWWYLLYDATKGNVYCGEYSFTIHPNIAFASKEAAQKAIDTIGVDRLKKYYFMVNNTK